jgi:hypothetical protein
MAESRVGRRIRSGVMGGEVAKSYNCARNNENNNNLGFGSSALAIGRVAHSFASVLAFNVSSDIKCIPNSLN